MKEIKAFIQKEFLETTIAQLEENGARDITVIKVDALGNLADFEQNRSHFFRKYSENYSSIIKLEVICQDLQLDKFLNIIKSYCQYGSDFEGMIFVYEVLQAINLKTGEQGDKAL